MDGYTCFLVPTIVLYGIYSIWPVLATLFYSLMDWNGFQSSGSFCGLDNYIELFADGLFWNSLGVTFLFILIVVPVRFFIVTWIRNSLELEQTSLSIIF